MKPHAALEQLWAGVEAYDTDTADQALVRALWDFPLSQALTEVVLPFLSGLGDRWENGELSVAHEHFASNLLRRRLSGLAAPVSPEDADNVTPLSDVRRPLAVLACPPGERHDLVLLCFSLLLAESGWRTLFLGADTPIAALVAATRKVDPDAVVLAATRSTAFAAAATALSKLAEDYPVRLAGRGADAEVCALLGAQALTDHPVTALAEVLALAPVPAPRAS